MRHRWAFAAITLCSLAVFAPALIRNEVFSIRDHGDYFQPLHWFTADELRHGRLPLWNVYSASGEPWLANPQTGVFYPPAWLFVVLPFTLAYTLFLLLHVVLLGSGAYLLFARLTRPGGAALAAALALTFSGPVMSLLDASNNLTTFAWIPLILWCALAGVSPRVSALAIALSFLAGEPFFAAVGAILFTLMRRRGVRDLIEVALTSFALASIQLLPFLSMVQGSDRANGGVAPSILFRDSVPPGDWLQMALPPNHGAAYGLHLGQHFILIIYTGLFTLALALAGVVVGRRRAAGWLLLIASCVFISLGKYFAPSAALLTHLPLTVFRYPARVVPLAVLGVCALAAIGCERLIRGRWQFVVALLMFADVVLQIQPLLRTTKFNPHRVAYSPAIGRDAKMLVVDKHPPFDRDSWISGYLNLYDHRFDALTAAPLMSQRYAAYVRALEKDSKLLNEMSVGYLLAPGVLVGMQPLASHGGVVVNRNPRAFPLAFSRDDVTRRVRSVRTLAFTSSSVFIDVDMEAAGDVIVTQQNAPGWQVTVDGKAATPHEISLFRTVHVARGSHSIRWSYRPLALFLGAILTFSALLRMLFSSGFVKRERPKNFLHTSRENA